MSAPIAMGVRPITTSHLDLDHLPLPEKDFQIKDTIVRESPIKVYYRYRDQYLNQANQIGLWESILPKYQFLEVHIFPEIVHYCHTNYNPSQREVMYPSLDELFTITTKSINAMLQLQHEQNLTPLSIGNLLNQFPNLITGKIAEMFQTFIRKEKHIPKDPPPYVATIFSPFGQDIVPMISRVLRYTTSEYIDEIILAFMSIFTLGQPPPIIYDYAKFIVDKMHDQLLIMNNE